MGLFRLVYKIGRMVFRDFLFKIPKKYLVVIIVFLSMFILKSNVFAYSLGDAPIKNLDDITERVKYSDIIEFYEYFPLFDGVWASNEFVNNGSVYALSTRIYPFNDENNSVWLKGQMFFPRYSDNIYQNGIIQAGYDETYGTSLNNWGWVLACNQSGWLKSVQWLKGSNYTVTMPDILVSQNVVSFEFTGYSNGNISGRINNSVFSKTYTEPNEYTSYLYNRFPIRLNYGQKTNGQVRVQSLIFKDTNGNITHALYPAKANILGVATYGLYDTYGGDFYSLSGVEFNKTNTGSIGSFNSASFGNVLTGEDIPANNNNWYVLPHIVNSSSEIESWNFENLTIDSGTILASNNNIDTDFVLYQVYNNSTNPINLSNYKTVLNGGTCVFNVPRSDLLLNNSIVNGRDVTFSLYVVEHSPTNANTYVLGTYTFNLSSTEQSNINDDRTQQELTNISNSQQETTNAINNTNNFLQDTSINDSEVNISAPSVSNSGISDSADNSFNSFITGWANLLSANDVVSVDIYIPNYITNGGQKFITIRSDMVRNFLSSTSLIPGINLNLLVVVQTLWTAMFAWFFYLMIVGFVNGIYSGELFSDKGLKELTNTYTGVAKNML